MTTSTTTPPERSLGHVAQIPPGEGRTFRVADGRRVAVFRTRRGELFATQASCPHAGGPLADGLLGDDVLVCPLHDRTFELRTGRTRGGAGCGIATYPVRAGADGEILLTLPAEG